MLPSLASDPRVCPVEVLTSRFPAPDQATSGSSLPSPCSSLVQIGKNQAAPAPLQSAPGPEPSPTKDNRGLSLLILLWGAA